MKQTCGGRFMITIDHFQGYDLVRCSTSLPNNALSSNIRTSHRKTYSCVSRETYEKIFLLLPILMRCI